METPMAITSVQSFMKGSIVLTYEVSHFCKRQLSLFLPSDILRALRIKVCSHFQDCGS